METPKPDSVGNDDEIEQDKISQERKKASQIGVLLGGIVLILGAVFCLIYILLAQPWKLPS